MFQSSLVRIDFHTILVVTVLVVVSFLVFSVPVEAQLFEECNDATAANSELCKVVKEEGAGDDLVTGSDSLVAQIVNFIVLISGAIAVIMIVIGGLRYVLSNGDPQGTQSAKNTILYAIIGLIVAIAARSIVLFVLSRIG